MLYSIITFFKNVKLSFMILSAQTDFENTAEVIFLEFNGDYIMVVTGRECSFWTFYM